MNQYTIFYKNSNVLKLKFDILLKKQSFLLVFNFIFKINLPIKITYNVKIFIFYKENINIFLFYYYISFGKIQDFNIVKFKGGKKNNKKKVKK